MALPPLFLFPFLLVFILLLSRTRSSYQSVIIGEVSKRDPTRPIYEVKFPRLGDKSSSPPSPSQPGVTMMRMVTARGQAMRCQLPPPLSRSPPVVHVKDENKFDDIDELLAEYENKCFVRFEGWWTYEFCYRKHVVQKHIIPKKRDPMPNEVEDSFVLGKWDADLDVRRRGNLSEVSSEDAAFSQLYVNGTSCDLSGNRPRRVVIKYMCADEAVQISGVGFKGPSSDINVLKAVREVESCVYEIEFMNSAICNHPTYKEKMAAATRLIHCSMEEDEGPFEGLMSTTYKKSSLSL